MHASRGAGRQLASFSLATLIDAMPKEISASQRRILFSRPGLTLARES
uniref:Uncharacterized protein n=1 Tax=Arundo donax TaxID=35708 RepID=A0A0A9I2N8_ARUDO